MSDATSPRAPIEPPVLTGLARHLLCAVPQLVDPNFVRSVVLIVEHTAKGAFGLVLNNRLTTPIAEMAQAIGLRWVGPSDHTVGLGGPVETSRGFILHNQPSWDPLAEAITPGLFLTTSLEAVREAHGDTPRIGDGPVLALLGYAGWGEGQLEAEMAAGSWIAVPLYPGSVRSPRAGLSETWVWSVSPELMWSEALRAVGIDPARLVSSALGSGKAPQA